MIEMYAGLRMGEINALHREDIDFKNNVIHVRGTISRDKDYLPILQDETKTENGIREVPIMKELLPFWCLRSIGMKTTGTVCCSTTTCTIN